MGSFTFKWPHDGTDVYVTGTFDDWKKSEKLEKVGDVFSKTVTLPDSSEKIYYKFVVDDKWTTDHAAPKENDPSGNENNFLTPEDIVKDAPAQAAIINSVSPESTTAALAKDIPLEKKPDSTTDASAAMMSNVTPESTTAALAGAVPLEKKDKAAPASSALPGAFPETPATELEKEFKINPLPAADGAINPIQLAPGEKIPPSLAAGNGINSHVKLDPESYEKADTLPGVPELPPVSKNMIPESSLPIAGSNDAFINSVAPTSTTAALAGAVPLEPKAPAIVKESQEMASVDPEASAFSNEVKEKAEVESELLSKVSEAPSAAEGTGGKGTDKSEADKSIFGTVAATAVGLGGAAAATAVSAKDAIFGTAASAATQLPDSVKQNLPASVQSAIAPAAKEDVAVAPAAKEEVRQEVSPEVPEPVKESIKDAGASPEAAASTAAVEEKKQVEAELLKEVKPVPADSDCKTAATNGATENASKAPKTVPEPAPAAEKTPAKSVDATSSTAATTSATATPEKKKKNRLSTMLSKIKQKVSPKDKA